MMRTKVKECDASNSSLQCHSAMWVLVRRLNSSLHSLSEPQYVQSDGRYAGHRAGAWVHTVALQQ